MAGWATRGRAAAWGCRCASGPISKAPKWRARAPAGAPPPHGAFPVRSHTGDIGGRVPLGMGQGGLVLLAGLPEAEREEVIRFNIPRLHHLGFPRAGRVPQHRRAGGAGLRRQWRDRGGAERGRAHRTHQ
ncbi:hypothetical protein G6F68_015762 [Rhizopus microsporus]|nr:hypothetical protein G6F68_015762 [Rhizopus microsporus]